MNKIEVKKFSIRVWTEFELPQIRKHLLLIDDLYGTCGNCQQIGLKYTENTSCPKCKTPFHYLATRQKESTEISKILERIKVENLKLTLIDRNDFEYFEAKAKAGDIFQ